MKICHDVMTLWACMTVCMNVFFLQWYDIVDNSRLLGVMLQLHEIGIFYLQSAVLPFRLLMP